MPIKPLNPNNVRSTTLGASHEDHVHTGADGSDKVAHSDLTGIGTDDHHAEAHTIASHSDTTATGAELETLTDGSDADALHTHGAILTEEEVEDFVGGMVTGNTETLITVTYQDGDGTIDFVVDNDLSNYNNVPGWIADITGENLEDLADVTITSIASGEILKWNGSAWVNNTLAEAGISAVGHSHTESDITDLDHYATADFTTDFAAEDLANLATKEADDLDATGITDGFVLTADGAGATAWEASSGGGDAGLQDILMLGGM